MVSVYWREKAGAKFRKNDRQSTGEYWLRYNENAVLRRDLDSFVVGNEAVDEIDRDVALVMVFKD